MEVCVCQKNKHFSLREKDKFQMMNNIKLTYSLNKFELDKIMQHVLIEFCNVSVIGYNKYEDKFWCKSYTESICSLHIELAVKSKEIEYVEIKIMPMLGSINDINAFIYDFNESIQMYKTSNFIKNLLHTY